MTMKLTAFRAAEHRLTSQMIATAIAKLGDELGVDFKMAGGTIGQASGQIKIDVSLRDTGTGMSGAEVEFRRHAAYLGAQPDWFDKTFNSQGSLFKVTGLNPNAPKYPILAERVKDGRAFKFTINSLKQAGL